MSLWGVGWTVGIPDAEDFLSLAYGPNKGQANHARFDLPAFGLTGPNAAGPNAAGHGPTHPRAARSACSMAQMASGRRYIEARKFPSAS